jgi:putative membrane protein
MYYENGFNMMGNNGYFGGIMLLMMILVIMAIFLLVKYLSRYDSRHTKATHESALDLVKMRYAKGEIDEAEFKKISNNLGR